jgi:hypothetical protein
MPWSQTQIFFCGSFFLQPRNPFPTIFFKMRQMGQLQKTRLSLEECASKECIVQLSLPIGLTVSAVTVVAIWSQCRNDPCIDAKKNLLSYDSWMLIDGVLLLITALILFLHAIFSSETPLEFLFVASMLLFSWNVVGAVAFVMQVYVSCTESSLVYIFGWIILVLQNVTLILPVFVCGSAILCSCLIRLFKK